MLKVSENKDINSNLRYILEDQEYEWEKDEDFDIYHFYNLYNEDRTIKIIYDADEDCFMFERYDEVWVGFNITVNYYPYATNIFHHICSIMDLVNSCKQTK